MSDSIETVVRALIAAGCIFAAAYLGFAALQWIARKYESRYPAVILFIEKARKPFRLFVGLIAARVVSIRIAHLREGWIDSLDHLLQISIIASIVWLAVAAVSAIESQVLKNDLKRDRDAVDRRRFTTQISLLRRLITAGLIAVGVVAIMLTFPSVKSLGGSLIASAGLISIIAGLAAQTTLTNVFAGIQLALSDTIRVGDVVVVNQQSGTIAQLALTHVEIRLWDGRIMVIPSSYFISQPFENWTRNRNQIGGSVFIDVDWSTPVDAIRQEVTSVLEGSELWDGRRNFVLVSNIVGATMQLQIGVSAANTDNLFALQSLVREKVIDFLLQEYPDSIVRNRTESLNQAAPPASNLHESSQTDQPADLEGGVPSDAATGESRPPSSV